jgi:hypothetical protein
MFTCHHFKIWPLFFWHLGRRPLLLSKIFRRPIDGCFLLQKYLHRAPIFTHKKVLQLTQQLIRSKSCDFWIYNYNASVMLRSPSPPLEQKMVGSNLASVVVG